MNRVPLLIPLVLLLAFGGEIVSAQSGYDLYQKALVKERAVGNVEEALRLYQRIVNEFGSDHALAAKAQLRLGLLYERLGRKTEAQQAFQQVLSQYSDQADVVRQARAGLTRAGNAAKGNARPATLTVRQAWAGVAVDPLGKPMPDGKSFVFTDWETGDIAVRELATGKTRRLTNKGSWFQSTEFGMTPVPSLDGRQVAYFWLNKDAKSELRVIGMDGSQPRVLYRNDEVFSPTPLQWSADGKQVLALFTNQDRTNQLALVSLADGSARTLKSFGPYYPLAVRLSPDGRHIVYDLPLEEGATATDIYLWSVEEGHETLLLKHQASEIPLGWTPDGKRLLFASDRSGALGVWMIQVVNGKAQGAPELVRPEIGMIFPIAFASDGSYFFALRTGTQEVYTATMDWATNKPTAPPAPVSQRYIGANISSDWSGDGKSLVWITQHGLMTGELGWQTLSIHSFETGKTRELRPKLNFFDRPRWSPDGRFVLVWATDRKGGKGIYRVDVNTGEVDALTQSGANANHRQAAWSADGKEVFFQHEVFNPRSATFVLKEIATGREKELYRVNNATGANYPVLSPAGQQIAFIAYDQATKTSMVKLVPVSGGEARDLFVQQHDPKDPSAFYGLTWMPDGRELLLLKGSSKNEEPNTEIWRLPLDGGALRKFTLSMDRVRDLRIHPDGKRIAFTSGYQKSEIWVMENIPPAPPTRRASVSRR